MPRGGRRSGAPGKAYGNRSDLTQAPKAAKGQEYGKAGAQLSAQRAMPLSATPPVPTVEVTPLSAESQRRGEPITAGLPVGPGPGPSGAPIGLSPVDELRAIFEMYPNDDLAELMANLPKQMSGPYARTVEPVHPGGEDFPIPGHMPPSYPNPDQGYGANVIHHEGNVQA